MRITTLLWLLTVGCGSTSADVPRMSDEERAKLAAITGPLETQAAEREAERVRGLAAALGLVKTSGACPIAIELPDPRIRRDASFDLDRMKRQLHALERIDLRMRTRDDFAIVGPLAQLVHKELAMAKQMTFG